MRGYELGRGPIIFHPIITVDTALDEHHIDLGIGSRGFRIQVRPATITSAVLRISNIKGEVSKAISADPKPLFWTVPADEHYEGFLGMRMMVEDAPAPDSDGNPVDVEDGTQLEQRWYFTSETANTEIEIIEFPGS